MKEDNNQRWIKIRPGDQFLLLLLVPFFSLGLVVALYAVVQWQPTDRFERALKFVGKEVMMTALLFSALVFIRCFVSPKWLENALISIGRKVVITGFLTGCAITSLLIWLLLS